MSCILYKLAHLTLPLLHIDEVAGSEPMKHIVHKWMTRFNVNILVHINYSDTYALLMLSHIHIL